MKIILSLFLLAFVSLKTDASIYKDKAFFKIKNKVFFKSDYLELIKKHKKFKCYVPDSYLYEEIDFKLLESKLSEKFFVEQIIKLEKNLIYMQVQKMNYKFQINQKRFKECGLSKSDSFTHLLKFDLFIKQRFKKSGKTLRKSVSDFKQLIHEQVDHEFFF